MARLQRSDLALIVCGLAGLAAVSLLYEVAFPVAAVELKITRGEAVDAASDYVRELGADLSSFKRAVRFAGDTESLVFLQRTLGLEEASRWAREEVPIWFWELRWFKPQETEEWQAWVGLDGEVVGFRHIVEEAAPGPNLEEAAAQQIAETFLQANGWTLSSLRLVEASSEQQDNRTDHRFSWERVGSNISWQPSDQDAGTGSLRVAVRVQGDRVGSYSRFVRIPEEFSRQLAQTESWRQFFAIASLVLSIILALIAMVIAIVRYRSGDIVWQPAIVLGVVVGLMLIVNFATTWETAMFRYQTQIPWSVFFGGLFFGLLLAGLFYSIYVLFPLAAGESLARELFPGAIKGYSAAAMGKLLSLEMAGAGLRGYGLAALFLGYLTVFYWFARNNLGAWLPAEGPGSEIFNNSLPFLTPLTISLVAAISEEGIFRLFGISVCKKLFRSTLVALLIPAVIWAFAHSNYPVFPVYIRGIELTIGGVIFGIAFLHYGLLTCIVAHYVVDAVIIGLPLLTSGNSTYATSGLLVMGLALLPALLGFSARLRATRIESHTDR